MFPPLSFHEIPKLISFPFLNIPFSSFSIHSKNKIDIPMWKTIATCQHCRKQILTEVWFSNSNFWWSWFEKIRKYKIAQEWSGQVKMYREEAFYIRIEWDLIRKRRIFWKVSICFPFSWLKEMFCHTNCCFCINRIVFLIGTGFTSRRLNSNS